jgi:hypothetical protein
MQRQQRSAEAAADDDNGWPCHRACSRSRRPALATASASRAIRMVALGPEASDRVAAVARAIPWR